MNDKMQERDERQPEVLRVFQSKQDTKAFYDKIGKVYDLLADKSEEPVRQAALAMLHAEAGEQVLELGFGTGHCLAALAQAVGATGKVYGVDLSDEMRKLAEELLQLVGLADRVVLATGDASQLPFAPETFDAVFMSFTLELFDTPEIPQVLAECRRVLRPEGRIVVAGMSKEGADGLIRQVYEWTHQHFPNFVDCRPIFVRRALEAARFSVVQIEHQTIWVPVEIVLARKETNSGKKEPE